MQGMTGTLWRWAVRRDEREVAVDGRRWGAADWHCRRRWGTWGMTGGGGRMAAASGGTGEGLGTAVPAGAGGGRGVAGPTGGGGGGRDAACGGRMGCCTASSRSESSSHSIRMLTVQWVVGEGGRWAAVGGRGWPAAVRVGK